MMRRSWTAGLLVPALACAGNSYELPEHIDGPPNSVLVVTTELDPAELEELSAALEGLVDAEGYAIAVSYGERIELLPECSVPVLYDWETVLVHEQIYDSDHDLFVTRHPGLANTYVLLERGAHAERQIQRLARVIDYVPDHVDSSACTGATHVLSEFTFGIADPDQPELLVSMRLEPLPDEGQKRWLARRERRSQAGQVALSVLGTITLASLAVICLVDLDNCSDDDETDSYASEVDESQRSTALGARRVNPTPAVLPSRGVELGRKQRVRFEAGAGGLGIRF